MFKGSRLLGLSQKKPSKEGSPVKYRVNLVRAQWFSIIVEAEDEDAAIWAASDYAPGISAQDSGWGEKWSVDADDWISYEDYFGPAYKPDEHGHTVEPLDGETGNDDDDDGD